uniref:CMP/dCMP-type deaminase domain-containing protein n=1 Tax=viral metagenome TaxID=1070528 RepID=A0A6C0LYZ3_9ZZZZ
MNQEKAIKYLKLARYQADLFSKDPSTKVAAIILAPDSHQILSTGFNGICRNLKETPERWTRPTKYKWVAHAEMNAVANAARGGIKIENSICVVTLYPCVECCKVLIQSGIQTIITEKIDKTDSKWDFNISAEMFQEAGLTVIEIDGESIL